MIFTYTYLHHSYNKDKGIARYYQVLQKILLMLAQSRECWSRFRVPWRRPSCSCCRDPNATESSGDLFITTDMGISSRHARHVIKLTKRYAVMHLKPCPHESGHFWNRIFFILIRPDEALNHSGERLQNNTVLMTGFTGFVRTEGRFV